MLVKNWMTSNPISVEPETSLVDAEHLMKENNICCLPVIKSGKLAGLVTEHDLEKAMASSRMTLGTYEYLDLLCRSKVKQIMIKDPVTIREDQTVGEATAKMLRHNISHLPVTRNGNELVGIITDTDIYRLMVKLEGIYTGGVQFALELEDRAGSIEEVEDVIRNYGGMVMSTLTSYENAPEGFRMVYISVKGMDRSRLKELSDRLEKNFRVLYVMDSREENSIPTS